MSFYTNEELDRMGFAHLGKNVLVSRHASLYGIDRISIESNSRIDDFCVLSAGNGGIQIGRYVHIAVMCSLIGEERIALEDFSGLSGRVSIYSSSDDYSGEHLTNPTVPSNLTQVDSKPVAIGRHVIIGSGSVVLPGVTIGEGAAVGALALVRKSLNPFTVYAGSPTKAIGSRSRRMLELENLVSNGDFAVPE
ncbi:MAG: acyltransferase [Gammaproteobacteria bacterium]|nr:acyltransferase [Gammaproteobacteria bacterium]